MIRYLTFVLPLLIAACQLRAGEISYANPPMPRYRVEAKPFKASAADIKAVCTSAGRELWRFFPDYKIEAIVVQRDKRGPMVLHKRNDRGEIVLWLNTGGTFWCQYAYQFAHEFCHVLCGYDEDWKGNMWFEETICEMASLYAMRAMAKTWEKDPPYKHWADYRKHIASYVQNVIDKREKVTQNGLQAYYEKHKETLRKDAGRRDLNGAMAVPLLELFEEKPERWEAVRWLNSKKSPKGETFETYIKKWHGAVPEKHKTFVRQVAGLYGVKITGTAQEPTP